MLSARREGARREGVRREGAHHRWPAVGRRSRRCVGDEGSSLLLMPVAVLIVLLLGAIAVDLSAVRLAHRDLIDVAASGANDAATAGLDPTAFRRTGTYAIDLGRAYAALDRSIEHRHLAQSVTHRSITAGPGPDEITVELEMTVPAFFAKSLPGAPHATNVRAQATASSRRR